MSPSTPHLPLDALRREALLFHATRPEHPLARALRELALRPSLDLPEELNLRLLMSQALGLSPSAS